MSAKCKQMPWVFNISMQWLKCTTSPKEKNTRKNIDEQVCIVFFITIIKSRLIMIYLINKASYQWTIYLYVYEDEIILILFPIAPNVARSRRKIIIIAPVLEESLCSSQEGPLIGTYPQNTNVDSMHTLKLIKIVDTFWPRLRVNWNVTIEYLWWRERVSKGCHRSPVTSFGE